MERYDIGDLIKIGLRRFFWIFIPFLILLSIGLVVLEMIPARYHSKALLIVEDQQVSPDLVRSAVQQIAEDRLETIKAEVRARNNVVALSEKFGLMDPSSEIPFSEKVKNIRDDIRIKINRVDNNRRSNEASTITFEIGFVHENPQTAFRVANQLMTDFLEENAEARQKAAEDTAGFFRDEERDLRRELTAVQREIAAVREANPGLTPDALAFNRTLISRLTSDIERGEQRLESIEEELGLLRMRQPIIIDSTERSDIERVTLREKRRALNGLKQRYTDTYPDVITLTEEVLDLEARLEPAAFIDRARNVIRDINQRLDNEEMPQDERNDLITRRDDLQSRIRTVDAEGGEMSLARLQFETQETALLGRMETTKKRLTGLREELAEVEARMAQMPDVAAELATLKSEETRLQNQIDRTRRDRAEAERTESLEEQQKAERVTTLEAPVLPDVPTSPDKPKVAVMLTGIAGGVAAVLGLAPVFLFPKVETKRQLGQVMHGMTVIEVPEIVDEEERKFRRMVFVGLVVTCVVLSALTGFVAFKVLVA